VLGIGGYAVLLCFCTLTLSISISESFQGSAPMSWYTRDTGNCVIFCSNALFIIHLMNRDVHVVRATPHMALRNLINRSFGTF